MKAKEVFRGIRAEVVKTEQAREMLECMRAKEGAKTQSYPAFGRRWILHRRIARHHPAHRP